MSEEQKSTKVASKLLFYRVAIVNENGILVHSIEGVPMTTDDLASKMQSIRLLMSTSFFAADGGVMTIGAELAKKTTVVCVPMSVPDGVFMVETQSELEGVSR